MIDTLKPRFVARALPSAEALTVIYSRSTEHPMAADPSTAPVEQPEPIVTPVMHFSLWQTFKHHIPRFIITILVDVVLPIVIYFLLQKRIKPVGALLISGVPPLVMVIVKAIFSRTFDALGFLVFIAFLISAIVALVTHNPILLLLEKSIVTAILSLVFALTLIPWQCCHHQCQIRPLAYYFYQDLVPTRRMEVGLPNTIFLDEQQPQQENDITMRDLSPKQEVAKVYEWIYAHCPSFRSACHIITSIWSVGFLLEFLARLILILVRLSINKIFIYGHVILTLITVVCIVLTVICISKERRQTLLFIHEWNKAHSTITLA